MKKIFPSEFSDLLNTRGKKLLTGTTNDDHQNEPIKVIPGIINTDTVEKLLLGLEKHVYPHLKHIQVPIDSEWKKQTKKNFTEKLGKSMHFRSQLINSKNNKFYDIAAGSGLIDMLRSASYKRMGEVAMNKPFGDEIGKQVICYEHGDYVSPHTDYFPEYPNLKNGYFDIHLMLCNKQVKHQWLVYEQKGYLRNMVDVSMPSGIAVYNLPFWHQVTPLISKNGNSARRWLFLGSFEQGTS